MSNFHKTFGDFDLNLLVGTTTEATKTTNNTRWGYNFVTEGLYSFNNIIKANQYFKESTVRKRMVGLYGEFRASYKNLVYLTVTGRNDWSSTLPVNNRSYFYPSVSGSFVFTELLPKNNVLSFGKIRGSWARVGKDADAYSLGYYMWPVATLNGGKYGMGNSWTGGSVGLKPEIQDSYELGLEMRFFNGRLGFDYTYYQSKTKDQICAPRLAQSTGYIFLTLNGGSVENKGMELSITGKPIVTKDFQWETTLNLSGNRGRLGDFIDGVDIFYVTDAQVGASKTRRNTT
jgi:outer membrane receptor protein involved in Fe transport